MPALGQPGQPGGAAPSREAPSAHRTRRTRSNAVRVGIGVPSAMLATHQPEARLCACLVSGLWRAQRFCAHRLAQRRGPPDPFLSNFDYGLLIIYGLSPRCISCIYVNLCPSRVLEYPGARQCRIAECSFLLFRIQFTNKSAFSIFSSFKIQAIKFINIFSISNVQRPCSDFLHTALDRACWWKRYAPRPSCVSGRRGQVSRC